MSKEKQWAVIWVGNEVIAWGECHITAIEAARKVWGLNSPDLSGDVPVYGNASAAKRDGVKRNHVICAHASAIDEINNAATHNSQETEVAP